jgi:hypothetical protein
MNERKKERKKKGTIERTIINSMSYHWIDYSVPQKHDVFDITKISTCQGLFRTALCF